MGLDVKTITVIICKFSSRSICKYVKEYPIISGLMCLLFLIYLFNPPIFVFLIYISPLIVVVSKLLYYFYLKPRKSKNVIINKEKRIEKFSISSKSGGDSDRPVATKPTRSMSQRRNKERFFVEADPTTSQEIKASISDFLMAATPATTLDLLDKVGFIEEKDKNDESTTMKENQQAYSESKDLLLDGETSNHGPKIEYYSTKSNPSDFSLKSHKGVGGEEFGSSEEDEEMHEDRNKAVEWNEDDQKNLMDLGISEMERNKRLENLIARRRAKKLFKMNTTEKGIMDIDVGPCSPPGIMTTSIITPVLISRNDPIHVNHGLIDDQFPGSAPSILLPGKNPFDLPYDPYEEKPDLMADSFQQEFSITPHKEILMCRHESFSLGPLFPSPGMFDGQMGRPRPTMSFGNFDEEKPSRHNDPIARTVSVTDLVTDLLDTKEPDQSPRNLSDESVEERESKVDSEMKMDKMERIEEKNPKQDTNKSEMPIEGSEISPNPRPPALPRPIPKAASASDISNGASLSIIQHTRVDDHYQNKGSWHTPTNSVASDLQVEVSEVGSPPSTVDGTDTDDDKSLTYDGDVEKEINSGSDELWGLSPHAPRIGKHELALRFLDEASEEGMRKTRLSTNMEESISETPSHIPLEIISRIQVTEKYLDGEIKSDTKQGEEEAGSEHMVKDDEVGPSTSKNDAIVYLGDSKEIVESLNSVDKVEWMKHHDTGESDGKAKLEELKPIEKQTSYKIKDDQLKEIEEFSAEIDSYIERELLQGPEQVDDVIVQSIEQTDSSKSIKDLIGTIEQLHHEETGEKFATFDPSINDHNVLSTQVKETSKSLKDIADLRENLTCETIHRTMTPSESQHKGPFKVEKEHPDAFEVGANKPYSSSSPRTMLSIQPSEQPLLESSRAFSTTKQPHCITSKDEAHIDTREMGTLDYLHGATKIETTNNYGNGESNGKDKLEKLKSIEKQTIYEIKDDELKPKEKASSELDSHIERELLQGPEKVADVIVKSTEKIDSSKSTKDLAGTIEQLHHEESTEKLSTLDPSINNHNVVSARVKETPRFVETIEDLSENITGEIIQGILIPSESQWTGPLKIEKEHSDTVEVGAKKTDTSSSPTSTLSIQPKAKTEEDIIYSSFNPIPSNHDVVPTQANETLRSVEEVKNFREGIKSRNMQQILESGETQLENSFKNGEEQVDTFKVGGTGMNLSSTSTTSPPLQMEVVLDDDLISSSSLLSPVSVLADMNQEKQLSPPTITEHMHDLDHSVFPTDQNIRNHHNSLNEQPLLETSIAFSTTEDRHRSTSTNDTHINDLEMGSTNVLVNTKDQRHGKMDRQSQQQSHNYEGETKPINSIDNIHSSDSGTTNETYPMQECSKSSRDDNFSPTSSAHVEVAVVNISKTEANHSHTTPKEKVEEKNSRDLIEENRVVGIDIDGRNEGDSLFSITHEAVSEPSNPNNVVPYIEDEAESLATSKKNSTMDPPSIAGLISSTPITSESLSSLKQEGSEEPLRESSLMISSGDIHDAIIESIIHEEVCHIKPLNPTDHLSLSSTMQEANYVSSKDIKASSVNGSPNVVKSIDCASLEHVKEGFISPLREEITVEPLEQADSISPIAFDGKPMEKIRQEPIWNPQLELAELTSSTQQEAIGEPLKVVDFISSNVLDSESTLAKLLELARSTSEKPVGPEELVEPPKSMESKSSMIMIEESPQPDYLISSTTVKDEPLQSMKEDSILEQPKPTGSSSSTTMKGDDSSLSLQQEAHDEKSLSSIKEEVIVQPQKIAESISSFIDEAKVTTTPLQGELLHIDPSKSIGEIESSSINRNVSHEQNLEVKMGIEHNIDDSVDSLVQIHSPNTDNNQSSKTNDDIDGHASQTTNRQEVLPMMSKQST